MRSVARDAVSIGTAGLPVEPPLDHLRSQVRHLGLNGDLDAPVRQHRPAQDLLQALPVAADGLRRALRQQHAQSDPLFPRLGEEARLQRIAEVAERQRLLEQVHPPRLDLRQIEDVVDDAEEVMAGRVDVVEELLFAVGQTPLQTRLQDFRESDDGIQRRAQLMAHVRQELALLAGALIGLVALALAALDLGQHLVEISGEASDLVLAPGGDAHGVVVPLGDVASEGGEIEDRLGD